MKGIVAARTEQREDGLSRGRFSFSILPPFLSFSLSLSLSLSLFWRVFKFSDLISAPNRSGYAVEEAVPTSSLVDGELIWLSNGAKGFLLGKLQGKG